MILHVFAIVIHGYLLKLYKQKQIFTNLIRILLLWNRLPANICVFILALLIRVHSVFLDFYLRHTDHTNRISAIHCLHSHR